MKILVINGPNLNLLGAREESNYGTMTLNDIENVIKNEFPSDHFEFFQSNHEGEIIEKIQYANQNVDGLIINPGGYSHSSVAIRDALETISIPKIEVHLSNLSSREDFRKNSITAAKTNGYISGFKEYSYLGAIYLIKKLIDSK
ncbi:MAG: type II 3-dehydroquinate dehydratase [Melioribacteraceae bacterium]|nr:type II 3-dehydroquinate dehydratase [Melioribacteraceae bacterium]